jgi:peptidyl-prolyl cis-trans isomerase B (cyclophilin B)
MPRHVAVLAAALLLVGLPIAAAAPGKESKYLLKAKAEKETVKLGEKIRIEVTLFSSNPKPTPIWKMDIGSPQGLVVYVKTEAGRSFQVAKLFGKGQGKAFKADTLPKEELKGGKSVTGTLEFLAIRTGKIEFTPSFTGIDAALSPDAVDAKPVVVTVEPGPKGEKRIGAKIKTDKGDIVAELSPDRAYNTVHNFLMLGQLGFYNGQVFHRVIADFMVQTGCPKGNGSGGPGYYIPGEVNDLKLDRGVIAMALEGPRDTGGSQFFILTGKGNHLEGTFTGFGKVVEGMDVLDALAATPVKKNERGEPSDPLVKPKLLGVETVLLP